MRYTTGVYARKRQRIYNGRIAKQHRLELRRLENDVPSSLGTPMTPPESPAWDEGCSDEFSSSALIEPLSPRASSRLQSDMDDRWKIFLVGKEGLLDIVVRTMALVRRNHMLQERVNALRAETREFIRSVLNNPENKRRQERLESGECKDTTSIDNSVSKLLFPPTPVSSSSSSPSFIAIPDDHGDEKEEEEEGEGEENVDDDIDDDNDSSTRYNTDWDSEASRSSYYDN